MKVDQRIKKLERIEKENGIELIELVMKAQTENVKSLRAVKQLMHKCNHSPEVRKAVLDALPKKPVVEFAVHLMDYDRIQVAASLLWLYPQYPLEVNEFLRWLKLPAVESHAQLKKLMQNWIVEEN